MAYHFIKLTDSDGKPVFINGDHVAAVRGYDSPRNMAETVLVIAGNDEYVCYVKESPETVTDLLYGVMH